uniref:Uncharacterized protein n=1 Tax=Neotessella volvocina TaxID=52559 RepID=A0A3G2R097_9STRA|nr:hypothetical protein [Neotessella volvocina]AYO28768.1 hypothetical protein [Neotessella volvocina]
MKKKVKNWKTWNMSEYEKSYWNLGQLILQNNLLLKRVSISDKEKIVIKESNDLLKAKREELKKLKDQAEIQAVLNSNKLAVENLTSSVITNLINSENDGISTATDEFFKKLNQTLKKDSDKKNKEDLEFFKKDDEDSILKEDQDFIEFTV